MDTQDTRKIATSEHESNHGGVHLCHKCGWQFPNSHPSAKHRRAHKKICGKIEGYKCSNSEESSLHLTVSEDGHFSDDDLKTPSPKVVKSVKTDVDSSGGGVGEISNRSGYEVFLDADTEFSDAGAGPSPGLEEHMGGAKDLVSTTLLDKEGETTVSTDISNDVTIYPSCLIETRDGVKKGDGLNSEEKVLVSNNESVTVTPDEVVTIKSLNSNSLGERGSTFSESDTTPELESVIVTSDKFEGCDTKDKVNSEEHLKDGSSKLMAEVISVEGEPKMLDIMDNSSEKKISDDGTHEIERTLIVSSIEGQVSPVSDKDPSKNIIQEHDTDVLSDTDLLVSLMAAYDNQTMNLVCGNDTGNLDEAWDLEQKENIADSDNAEIRISGIDVSHLIETHNEDSQESRKESERNSENNVILEGPVATFTDLNRGGDVELAHATLEKPRIEEPLLSPVKSSVTVEDGQARVLDESLREQGDKSCNKQQSVVSVDSLSQTDSLEGNWGSVSDATGLSALSDATAIVDSEALLPLTDSQASATAKKANNSNKADSFEPPSFMTLVDRATDPNVIQNLQESNSASSQTGWFPSPTTHAANNSQGRKKNEEVIDKVKNWTTVKQRVPLKSLLDESNTELKLKDGIATKSDSNSVTTVNTILGPGEPPIAQAIKAETGKEWNSPARYPVEIKREGRKAKGKPYWVPFVCCSSVN